MLVQQIAERLVGQFLEIHHAVTREERKRLPGLVVKLHPLSGHRACSFRRSIAGA
jgi:hypothetical protein